MSAADADAVDVCDSLDNMLAVCQDQKERLAECKGQAHAQKIREGRRIMDQSNPVVIHNPE